MRTIYKILLFSAIPSFVLLHGDVFAGPKLAEQCVDCHGESGNSKHADVPTIAGLSKPYFIATMEDFRTGARPAYPYKREGKPDTDMAIIAKKLDADEVKHLADYFSQESFIRSKQNFDTVKAKAAKKMHLQLCEKCHENVGSSVADDAGILAGQKMAYLQQTLEDLANGKRSGSEKMKKKLDKLVNKSGKEALQYLVHYYGAQQ